MQLGKKSQKGLRTFLRDDHIIVADKRGKPRVIIGSFDEKINQLRAGNPSAFSHLGGNNETFTA